MDGFNFAVPAIFVSYATILMGGIFVVTGWLSVIRAYAKEGRWEAPISLYAFTGSVCIELVGLIVLSYLPYDLASRKVYGWNSTSFVWSAFQIASVILALISLLLIKNNRSPARHTARMGAIVLLVIASLGLVWYLA